MQIEITNLSKSFSAQRIVLDHLSFTVDKGEIVALLGPSGCGKSTVLRILAGLETQDRGEALINGQFSFVFQEALLLEWRSALANTKLPLEMSPLPPAEIQKRAQEALQLVGLADNLDDFPEQLSGGMKMRVSLARALVTKPDILLLDEPFAALDEMTRERLNLEVLKLKETRNISALFVTHNIFEAIFMSDRILILGGNPATITADIKVDLQHPRNPEIKSTTQFAELVGEVQKALRSSL